MYAASWRLGCHTSRFHLCFWLRYYRPILGSVSTWMYAAALEAWQPIHPPKLAPVLEKQLHHPHNFCPKTRNIIFSKTKENPKQTFLLHMYNVFNLKISKEKVENDLAAHTFGHICFVWGQRGDVVASDEIFSFRNSFHTSSRIFFLPRKRIQTFSSFSTWFVWKRIQEFVLKNANNVSCPLLFLPFPLNWANTNFQFQIQRWNIWRIFFGLMFIVGYLGRCGWNACVQKGQLTVNCD